MIDYTEGSNKQYHTQLEENGVGDYVILTGIPKSKGYRILFR